MALAKVEEAFKHERETKEAVRQVCQLCSFHSLSDTLEASDDETDENRLLPAMINYGLSWLPVYEIRTHWSVFFNFLLLLPSN